MSPTRSYLDHAATTPVLPQVIDLLAADLRVVGNASSVHSFGRDARRRIEESRESLAVAVGARPSEVIFTSGGTESDNLAIQGMWRARSGDLPGRRRIVAGAIEHSAVRDCVQALVDLEGAEVTWVPVDRDGRVGVESVRTAIESGSPAGPADVALVTVMWVNNEVGTVQPIREIAQVAHDFGIPVHTDAVQAIGHLPVDFVNSGVDTAAISGHKVGGPPGVGALLARRDAPIQPIGFGGGQERQLRSGTVATALVVALAAATTAAVTRMDTQVPRLARLRDRLITQATAAVPGVAVTGAWTPGDTELRSPANAHLLIPEVESDSLLFLLDAAGIACSTGSACHAGVPEPSHVVMAMGYTEEQAGGALRLTLGHTSSDDDVDRFLAAFPEAVQRAQRAHRARLVRRRS